MFLGHYGVAFAAKRLTPRTCSGWLLGSAQALDLVWPVFLLLGIEHVRVAPGLMAANPLDFYDYPWTHSLLGACGWAILFALIYFAFNRNRLGAMVVAALVVSHWVLDLLVHRPDLPLYPGGPRFGLGIWNSVPATLVLEAVVFVGGLVIYLKGFRARNRQGAIALWSFVAFVTLLYLASTFGPPPGDTRSLAWAALGQWIIIPWGIWIDRHREVAGGRGQEAGRSRHQNSSI